MKTKPTLQDRFWSKVEKSDGCWVWTGSTERGGYGHMCLTNSRKMGKAHRISWELHFGKIPDGMMVCHHCDNPPCVRPDHLFLGSNSDNVADMIAKKRDWRSVRPEAQPSGDRHGRRLHPETCPRGESSGQHILTEQQVIKIRKMRSAGMTLVKIASMFGVSFSAIHLIATRKSWKHIP